MNKLNKIFHNIIRSIYTNYYIDLGNVTCDENSTCEILKINVVPYNGIHKDKQYVITLNFIDENSWPLVYIDSEIYDKVKTNQYIKNKGKNGNHKGICIKNLSYSYPFDKNFKELCNNEWKNYIYYLITLFNNFEDFERGNGIKSNYKKILSI
jgi:hypothetical protein